MEADEAPRAVDTIQADVRRLALELAEWWEGARKGLTRYAAELESHLPDDPQEYEPLGQGRIPPTLALEVSGAVESAREDLDEVLVHLRKAASLTEREAHLEWFRRRRATAVSREEWQRWAEDLLAHHAATLGVDLTDLEPLEEDT